MTTAVAAQSAIGGIQVRGPNIFSAAMHAEKTKEEFIYRWFLQNW
jgi:predicted transposase YbfD/YdcC